MRVLVLDNYDSFTYNLVQYFGDLGAEPIVVRNDEMSPAEGERLRPDRLVISPGPGTPDDTGFCMDYIRTMGGTVPILGVCLGHQTIVAAFGGEIGRAPAPRHGKVSVIDHDGKGVFAGLPDPFQATRYHSLAATSVPDILEITARSEDGVVQAVRHRTLPIEGVQFHPESIMTEVGRDLLANFLAGPTEILASPTEWGRREHPAG
ncbi:MAG: aminodeoxychorismate/anthranilate synthase component II [Acidimicrobiia bacterium]